MDLLTLKATDSPLDGCTKGGLREWQSTLGFLPGELHGQRGLAGYSPWGRKESDTTEQVALSLFTFLGDRKHWNSAMEIAFAASLLPLFPSFLN